MEGALLFDEVKSYHRSYGLPVVVTRQGHLAGAAAKMVPGKVSGGLEGFEVMWMPSS